MNRRNIGLTACRKTAGILLLAILGGMLAGCGTKGQKGLPGLAKEEPVWENGTLCGMLVTWGEQEIEKREENQETVIELKPSLFGGNSLEPLFETPGIVSEGTMTEDGRVLFDGVEGAEFIYCTEEKADEGGSYTMISSMGSSAFDNVHYSENVTDEGEQRSATADCHVSTRNHGAVYINPIYVREDGSYYTKLHTSAGYLFGENSPGPSFGQTMTESVGRNGDMGEQSDSFSVGISLVATDEVKSVRIREMDADDRCIRRTDSEYREELLWELLPDTEYVLVEETAADRLGKEYVHRTVYDRPKEGESAYHTSYFCTGSQVLEAMTVELACK